MENQTRILVKLQKSSITFFVNIGEQTAKNLPQPTNSFSDYLNGNYAANLFMFPTCEAEILHTTTNLKASTSEGYDNVSTKLLKQTVKEVATPLAHIVNLSLSHGIFPNDMKLAKIVPIFKNGNTKLFNNYRPIRGRPELSSFSKEYTEYTGGRGSMATVRFLKC